MKEKFTIYIIAGYALTLLSLNYKANRDIAALLRHDTGFSLGEISKSLESISNSQRTMALYGHLVK